MKGVTSPDVGRALRIAREMAGLEPARVARIGGVSAGELRRIEAGEIRPSIAILQRLAGAVGADLLDMVRRADGRSTDGRGRVGVRTAPRLGVDELAHAIVELPSAVGSKIDAVASAAVLHAMVVCRDNQSAAARLLGMERKAFVRRLQRARRRRK